MTPLVAFVWGFAGSLAVEVVAINQAWNTSRGRLPARYKNGWFWFCRALLAAIGGGLAVAYGIKDNPMLAINIGASTPLIVQALARGVGSKVAQLPSEEELR